jgi:hypothetical protein
LGWESGGELKEAKPYNSGALGVVKNSITEEKAKSKA